MAPGMLDDPRLQTLLSDAATLPDRLFAPGCARQAARAAVISPTFLGHEDLRSLAAAVVDLLGSARALDLLFGLSGGASSLALIHSAVVDAFEEVRLAAARYLELRDDFLAEARNTDERGDLAHALSGRRGNFEVVLHRSTGVLPFENLPHQ